MKKIICLYLTFVLVLTGCGNLKSQIKGNPNTNASADQPTGKIIASDNTGIIEKQEKRESGSGNNIGNTGDNPNGVNGNDNNQNGDNPNDVNGNGNNQNGDNPNDVNGNGNNQNGDNNKPQLPDDGKGLLKDSAKWLGDHKGIALGIAAGIAVIGVLGFRGQPNFCAVNYFYVPQEVINPNPVQEPAVQEPEPAVQNLNPVLQQQYQQQWNELGELFVPELGNLHSSDRPSIRVMLADLRRLLTERYQLQDRQQQEQQQLQQRHQMQQQEQQQLQQQEQQQLQQQEQQQLQQQEQQQLQQREVEELQLQQLQQRLLLAQRRQRHMEEVAVASRAAIRNRMLPMLQLEYLEWQHRLIGELLQHQDQDQDQQQLQQLQQLELQYQQLQQEPLKRHNQEEQQRLLQKLLYRQIQLLKRLKEQIQRYQHHHRQQHLQQQIVELKQQLAEQQQAV